MEQTDYTMHSASVMVLGFGKVGMTTARLFSAVGCNVSVAIRKNSAAARVREMGLKPLYTHHLSEEIGQYQIIINTVPDLVLDESLLNIVSSKALIIDLASSPGGVDFSVADELGIRTIHALGLPGKVAPKTAGSIIADTFVSLLS
ncbi:NAD(P)-dependent oxidoreductase [Virgibacillus halophilus]|uniref:NAD(P)-dependent oxidoreductase n=2 Tax=Tigheibacillus halophilus TaxID=361280 RepID=A0ABU5C9D7_9BACI|nr:NAD(P)-dependent oxidoreductase [Virgibacillus halophilus]